MSLWESRSVRIAWVMVLLSNALCLHSAAAQDAAAAVPLPPMDATLNSSLYPKDAAKSGVQGRVLVEFNITHKGKVDNATVVQSEPEGVFDNAARNSLKTVKFTVPDDWDSSGRALHRFRLSYVFKIYPCPTDPCSAPKAHDDADDSMVISIQAPK